jgi:uncharacterized protein (DUF302 family)
MSYTITSRLENVGFDDAVARTRTALQGEGFGVLTEIDVKQTMKAKIGADIDDYLILGACNPQMAHRALELEPRVGAMLPCNVIVRSVDGTVEVSAIDPVASMTAIDNAELKQVAGTVRDKLRRVVESL